MCPKPRSRDRLKYQTSNACGRFFISVSILAPFSIRSRSIFEHFNQMEHMSYESAYFFSLFFSISSMRINSILFAYEMNTFIISPSSENFMCISTFVVVDSLYKRFVHYDEQQWGLYVCFNDDQQSEKAAFPIFACQNNFDSTASAADRNNLSR